MSYLLLHHPHLLSNHLFRSFLYPRFSLSTHVYGTLIFARLYIQSLGHRFWLGVAVSAVTLPLCVVSGLFLLPKHVQFNYAAPETCFFNPSLLPSSVKKQPSEHFEVSQPARVSIGSLSLFSSTTCVHLTSFSDTMTTEKVTLKTPISITKPITITAAQSPQVQNSVDPTHPIPITQPLNFNFSQVDTLSTYSLYIAEQAVPCVTEDPVLRCPLENLTLNQGTEYTYTLQRTYRDHQKQVLNGSVRFLDPLVLAASSPHQDQVSYEPLTSIHLTWNKPLKQAGTITLRADSASDTIPFDLSVQDATLIISPHQPLARGQTFHLSISGTTAQDGSFLDQDVTLSYQTSTGPKVTGVSLPGYKVGLFPSVRITFDIDLLPSQDIARLEQNGRVLQTRVSIQGSVLTLSPTEPLSPCTKYTIAVADDVQNIHGIGGNSAWSFNFKTICQHTFSIGSSVQGRAITAFKFGSGPKRVVFVGGTHGDERSSVLTLQAWIDELEQKYDTIPNSVTVVVIPLLNPDGYARSRRINHNNVDLNRNFPSNDWTMTTYLPNNVLLENGGGTQPLSEPESSALAGYIQSTQPDLILTYHASGSVVIANESGNSKTLAGTYSAKSGFLSSTSAQEDGIFSYPTTGEFETWTHDKLGIPTLLVELRGLSSNELRSQSTAMWSMLN